MKLYQKLISLLVAAVMAAVLMPVCMAAPGDSVETRINNALRTVSGDRHHCPRWHRPDHDRSPQQRQRLY